jgi:hypothetical protein
MMVLWVEAMFRRLGVFGILALASLYHIYALILQALSGYVYQVKLGVQAKRGYTTVKEAVVGDSGDKGTTVA